jgi:putative endonuclease
MSSDYSTGLPVTKSSDGLEGWFVYLLQCADNSFYAGVARDLQRRIRQHNGEITGGARYTQARRPVRLVAHWESDSRSQAQQREHQLKRLSRQAKLALLAGAEPPWEQS